MMYLSQQYAAATTGVEQERLLAAGEAVLSSWFGTPFQMGNVVGSIGMLLIGWVMLRSQSFTRAAGYVGIIAGVVALGMYEPKVDIFISILSVVVMQLWYMMITLTFWCLSKRTK